MSEKAAQIQETIDLLLRARAHIGDHGSFRLRTLLDMALLELGKDLERLTGSDEPGDVPQN